MQYRLVELIYILCYNKIMLKKRKLNPYLQIVLGFLSVILIGTLLLSLPISNNDGNWFGFIDSFFTSTSAVCVTGLTVVDVAIQFTTFGQIVLLCLIQIGGLGFITLTTLLFLLIGKSVITGTDVENQVMGTVMLLFALI